MTAIGRSVPALTTRQQEVLELLRRGYTNEEIAQGLGISLDGAKWHVAEIIGRLGVSDRYEAARWRAEGERRPWWSLVWLRELRWTTAAKAASVAAIGIVALGVMAMVWGLTQTSDDTETPAPSTMIVAAGGGAIAVDTRTGDVTERFGGLRDLSPLSYAISPDGTRAAFACGDDASARIGATGKALCIGDANGPSVVVSSSQLPPIGLLEDEKQAAAGAWSADGTKFAFLVYRHLERDYPLRNFPALDWYSTGDAYLKDLASGEVRLLDLGLYADSRELMRFSPDGSHLGMLETHTYTGRSDLVVFDVASGERHVVSESLLGDVSVGKYSWAPDGRRVAFGQWPSLYVASLDGSSLERIATAWDGAALVWSPDGEWIAADEAIGNRTHVYIVRRDGSDKRAIGGDLAQSGNPVFSPDSRSIAFRASTTDTFGSDFRIFVANVDGTGLRAVTGDIPFQDSPLMAWSPDGERIFYTASAGPCGGGCGPGYLYVANADGSSTPRRLHDEPASEILGWID